MTNLSHTMLLTVLIKYNLLKQTKIEPYIEVGSGYTWVDEIGAGTVNGGIGATWWFY